MSGPIYSVSDTISTQLLFVCRIMGYFHCEIIRYSFSQYHCVKKQENPPSIILMVLPMIDNTPQEDALVTSIQALDLSQLNLSHSKHAPGTGKVISRFIVLHTQSK